MYITKEELDRRLNKTELQIKGKERKERGKERRLEHEDRVLIGILEGEDTQKNIADLIGVSPMTVSNASRGLKTRADGVDKKLVEDIEIGKEAINGEKKKNDEQIKDQLLTNLSVALGHVALNIDKTDASEASKIAVDMSKILDRVTGSRDDGRGNRTAIIINVPQMKEEKSYQTITV